jgi:hypothetical protein
MTKPKYKFECWEVDMPSDDVNTRGISEQVAKLLFRLGWIDVVSEGIVTNIYSDKVLSHCYAPTDDKSESLIWPLIMDGLCEEITDEQIHRMLVLWLLAKDYHREHQGDYTDSYTEFHYTYFPWPYPGEEDDTIDIVDLQDIPRFAVISGDETYSMIHMAGSKIEAFKMLDGFLGQDTLGTYGNIIDLDDSVLTTHVGVADLKHVATVNHVRFTMSPDLFDWLRRLSEESADQPGASAEVLEEAQALFAQEQEPVT